MISEDYFFLGLFIGVVLICVFFYLLSQQQSRWINNICYVLIILFCFIPPIGMYVFRGDLSMFFVNLTLYVPIFLIVFGFSRIRRYQKYGYYSDKIIGYGLLLLLIFVAIPFVGSLIIGLANIGGS